VGVGIAAAGLSTLAEELGETLGVEAAELAFAEGVGGVAEGSEAMSRCEAR